VSAIAHQSVDAAHFLQQMDFCFRKDKVGVQTLLAPHHFSKVAQHRALSCKVQAMLPSSDSTPECSLFACPVSPRIEQLAAPKGLPKPP
jgi:hypothetical protein